MATPLCLKCRHDLIGNTSALGSQSLSGEWWDYLARMVTVHHYGINSAMGTTRIKRGESTSTHHATEFAASPTGDNKEVTRGSSASQKMPSSSKPPHQARHAWGSTKSVAIRYFELSRAQPPLTNSKCGATNGMKRLTIGFCVGERVNVPEPPPPSFARPGRTAGSESRMIPSRLVRAVTKPTDADSTCCT